MSIGKGTNIIKRLDTQGKHFINVTARVVHIMATFSWAKVKWIKIVGEWRVKGWECWGLILILQSRISLLTFQQLSNKSQEQSQSNKKEWLVHFYYMHVKVDRTYYWKLGIKSQSPSFWTKIKVNSLSHAALLKVVQFWASNFNPWWGQEIPKFSARVRGCIPVVSVCSSIFR